MGVLGWDPPQVPLALAKASTVRGAGHESPQMGQHMGTGALLLLPGPFLLTHPGLVLVPRTKPFAAAG